MVDHYPRTSCHCGSANFERKGTLLVKAKDSPKHDAEWMAEIIERTNRCPYYQLLGMELVEIGAGYARLRLPATKKLHQPFGVVHGGAVASIVDGAGGLALTGTLDLDERGVTVELKVNYISAVREGELIAEARVIHRGSRVAVVDVEVSSAAGKLVAKALGTYVVNRVEHAKHKVTEVAAAALDDAPQSEI